MTKGLQQILKKLDAIFAAAGAEGGSAWGDITGTLSDQTDLQTALDLKAPTQNASLQGLTTISGTNASIVVTGADRTIVMQAQFGIFMPEIPTSDPATPGQIWNDSGTLKISV